MNKRKGSKKLIKKIYIIIFILIAIILAILIIDALPKNIIPTPWGAPELYVIKDQCSVILNSLIHQIKSEGDCRIMCRNECSIREKEIHNSEFIEQQTDCNICNCYCK